MQFAGNDYAYLSKKKIDKINHLKNPLLSSIKEDEKDMEMTTVKIIEKEEGKKEEKINEVMDALVGDKSNKMKEDNRSDSCESFGDEDLDKSYSDDEYSEEIKPIEKEGQANDPKSSLKKYEQVVDTNIICIKFDFLKEKNPYATGEPKHCSQCNAYFSHLSHFTEEENKYKWDCEYCDQENTLQIEKEEIPKDYIMDYFIGTEAKTKKKEKVKVTGAERLIFCFDVSGSMDVRYNLPNKASSISRLDCVKNAIEENINTLIKNSPQTKVGLISFGSLVTGYGDCLGAPVVLPDNCEEKLINKLGVANQVLLEAPISKSQNEIKSLLKSCNINGSTCLGPAVLLAISMIEKSTAGSRILLCTDGEANVGLGCLSGPNPEAFYIHLGNLAKEKGIVINLVTFEDAESSIKILMHMIEITGGEIIRVNPEEIVDEFSSLLSNEVVAMNVSIQIKLHKTMCFKNEKAENLKEEGSTLVRKIGNVTKQTELYAEYGFKKSALIAKLPNFDISNLKRIYFQSVIDYTNKEGSKCIRVITKDQQVTVEKGMVEKQANFDIVSTNALQKSANIARTGDYRKAQANAYAWKNYIKSNISSNDKAKGSYTTFSNNFKDFHHDLNQINYNPCSQMNQQDKMNQRMFQMQTSSIGNAMKFTQKRQSQMKSQLSSSLQDEYDFQYGQTQQLQPPKKQDKKKPEVKPQLSFGDKFKNFFSFGKK